MGERNALALDGDETAMKTLALAAALAAPLALAAPTGAPAHDTEEGVAVVFALNVPEGGADGGEAVASLNPIREFVRAQPGLLDEQLLQGQVGVAQDYLHVTRWERLEDWEAMFEDQAFLDILTGIDPRFEPAQAEIYLPVR